MRTISVKYLQRGKYEDDAQLAETRAQEAENRREDLIFDLEKAVTDQERLDYR